MKKYQWIIIISVVILILVGYYFYQKGVVKLGYEVGPLTLKEGYITERNAEEGYEIQYPQDFKVQNENKEREVDTNRESESYRAFLNDDESIVITIDYFNNLENYSIDDYIKKVVPSDIKYEKTKINGISALKTERAGEYKDKDTFFFYKDKIYKISLYENKKDESGKPIQTEKGVEIYTTMLNSFRPL